MKNYQATYGGHTIAVTARHLHEAQSNACLMFGLAGKLQHLIKVRLYEGETA